MARPLACKNAFSLALSARQVGEHELHLAELGAHRPGRGEHLALQFLIARLDRGAEDGAAGVDLAQHHRDIGAHLAACVSPADRISFTLRLISR